MFCLLQPQGLRLSRLAALLLSLNELLQLINILLRHCTSVQQVLHSLQAQT